MRTVLGVGNGQINGRIDAARELSLEHTLNTCM